MDAQTARKQQAPLRVLAPCRPPRSCGVFAMSGRPQSLRCCWRFLIAAEWPQTISSRRGIYPPPLPFLTDAVAFLTSVGGGARHTSHLAQRPLSGAGDPVWRGRLWRQDDACRVCLLFLPRPLSETIMGCEGPLRVILGNFSKTPINLTFAKL